MLQTRNNGAGPYGAGVTPRLAIATKPSPAPITTPDTKLGGQPVWLAAPAWPLDRVSGEPMRFIGQFRVPGAGVRLAYLFITDEDGDATTAEPFGGRNALIVQPDGRVPAGIEVTATATGPTLCTRGRSWNEYVPVELLGEHVELAPAQEAALDADIAYDDAFRRGEPSQLPDGGEYPCSYVGGRARYPQAHLPLPLDESWDFFLQLEDGEGWDGEPYALNFGGGYGFLFLSADDREGAFFWDCS
ncbi:conserved hypothetical protein [Catenulispora acidiphila DSM 44928]|uniref:DUF1963 domain-containing protein n=1 Tax=Catenulispora acidiphila (strain DSM 44928 / JCM 14897 / NBRC 102108 / NRRL B-24433 / ID139908) TaxID=479433 RepID=C7QJV4_CATAD|nr:hypothetical protein [Catenulispora acidiphila]ACU73192.1 conserved hypothetical protein [Catenulispora acidiphila DSM 44928]